ncbi:Methyltransferase-like protein 23 [Phytophthora citrophthora]|uniref:Methyltransferase-like protein 23 n=1 Tax=Phytophthora citrophthora TaxID=4793 RepID=A0AAD9G353_9STRA|nr:Methyltransferase-like protein 23 [Phytophthora citrophthora]
MEETEAAPRRTFRFVCGSRNDDIEPNRETEPILKRQRVAKSWIVQVDLVELICSIDEANEDNDKHYGLFVWPSALILARFVAREANSLCRGKVLLELGCGTGLPSILAGLCGATKVYLTDRADAADVQRNAEANIQLNGLQSRAEFIPLVWGDMLVSNELVSVFQTVEIVLAADCFYQSEGSSVASLLTI